MTATYSLSRSTFKPKRKLLFVRSSIPWMWKAPLVAGSHPRFEARLEKSRLYLSFLERRHRWRGGERSFADNPPSAFGLTHFAEIQTNHPLGLFHTAVFHEALQRAFVFHGDKRVLLSPWHGVYYPLKETSSLQQFGTSGGCAVRRNRHATFNCRKLQFKQLFPLFVVLHVTSSTNPTRILIQKIHF